MLMFKIGVARAALVLLVKTGHMKKRSPASADRSLRVALHDYRRLAHRSLARREHFGNALLQLFLLVRDLVRMRVELFRQLRLRLVTSWRRQCDLRRERRTICTSISIRRLLVPFCWSL
jgi:hypothetical protein